MKILCIYTDAGPSYVRSGWARVFAACGHQFMFWRPNVKPAMDMFAEFEPDLFIGTTYDLDRAMFKCIATRPQMKVALFGSAWGDAVKDIDRAKYPIVVVNEQEKATIEALKKQTGKPDYVFIHVTNRYLEGTMGGWREIGVTPYGVLNAADTFVYGLGKSRNDLRCDLAFVGGYWPYKARNIDKCILPLCHPSTGLNVKIFGNSPWPVHQYLGLIDDNDVRDLFASATVSPNMSEPHSTDLGWDIVERPFKVLSSGGFCVSDYVEEAREVFTENELPMAKTPAKFIELVRHFIANPDARTSYMEAGRAKVLASHTYFDRVAQMLVNLGLTDEAMNVMKKKEELVK